MSRRTLPLFCLLLLLAFSACKGCSDPCKDVACLTGEVCVEGVCQPDASACDPACEDGLVCEAGMCVEPQAQCQAAGDECDASRLPGDGFLCLDLDSFGPRPGECVAFCAADGSCPTGSLCFFVASPADPACTTNDDCGVGRECNDGACLQTICRPSECDSFVEGGAACGQLYANVTDYASGAQCYAVGNGARYCYPAGQQGVGDACGDVIDAITTNDYSATCASGLACVDGICQQACLDDAVCSGGQECILEENDFVDTATGICGDACTPFEVGSCGAGQTCLPVSGEEGVCASAGDKAAFETCEPGVGECQDGLVCVSFQVDPPVSRCQPICNLTVAPPNDDGSVGEFGQSQRDATCPQPASSDAWFSVTNLAEIGGAVDVYIGDTMAPAIAGLALDARSDGDAATAGTQWLDVPPGATAVKVLPAGAPRTDPPLAEQTISFVTDEATELFVLPVAGASDEVTLVLAAGPRQVAAPAAGSAKVRIVAALVDVPSADVIVVPPGDDLSNPANQIELATALTPETISDFTELAAGDWDVLVFAMSDPRTDRATALSSGTLTLTDGQIATLALRGTVDPDDLPLAGQSLADLVEPPPAGQGGPTYTCVDIGAGVYGFCQQSCGNAPSTFGSGSCEGPQMGCHPTFLQVNNSWANLCAPHGDKALDASCDPFADYTECAEGLYCLEYGNTVANYSALERGRCTSLCVDGAPADPALTCATGQACETLSFDPDYVIGQCGYPCTSSMSYDDPSCPTGLKSCKPRAALNEDPANPDMLPTTSIAPSFCSASGDIGAHDTCTANDCVGGTECMFPRSEQGGFTSTILSQYFGGPGLTPSCMPQCDPFDGDSSATSCAADETCLFNYPYSAEVGHCAPVTVQLDPLQPCTNPGEACGKDSICVVNGGAPTCFQFCQYRGPDATGELQPESCAAGFLCAPLVNDIGVCLSP